MHQRIVVAGGGIGGLHFAAAAKAAGFRSVCVVERDGDVIRTNAGGGLGLWPPSLACANRIGALPALEGVGQYMPSAKYLDCRGRSLGQPSATFTDSKYPVLCLGRDRLLAVLYERCQHFGVDFVTGAAVETVDATGRTVTLADGRSIEYDVLVGADGIHSNVRRQIVAPHVTAQSCGYAYYRATTGGGTRPAEPKWRTDTAFEAWGDGIRFGYVPLKPPEVFWFAAVPLADEPAGVTARLGSRGAAIVKDSDTVDWLAGRFATWGNSGRTDGVDLSAMVRASVGDGILRTEICKVPNVTKFPWHAHGGRVVLLGDACHATAPNIAQGAGLSIEDGAELVHRLSQAAVASDSRRDFHDKPLERAMAAYASARKPRAAAVQLVADTIAVVGQQRGLAAKVRDTSMWAAARCFPGTTAFVFEAAVSYSLGGSGADLHWRPPAPSMVLDTTPPTAGVEIDAPLKMVPNTAAPERAGVCRAAGLRSFLRLPDPVRRARQSASVLLGTGTASVAHPTAPFAPANVMLAALRRLFMLPQPTAASGFVAGVAPATVATGQREAWTRVFGWPDGSTSAAFTTTMRTRRFLGDDKRCPSGVVLLEGAGIHPWIDRLVSFGYAVTISAPKPAAQQDTEAAGAAGVGVTYTSVGVWVGSCRLWFVPSTLLPRSSWREVVTVGADGAAATWRFEDGAIAWPFASLLSSTPLMRYSGSFAESTVSSPTAIRKTPVLVAGGTGLLGEAVVAALVQSGAADVTVLTRDAVNVARPVRGASYCSWDPKRPTEGGWRKLVTADTVVVNLAGENPGTKRWDASVKKRIVESRVGAIDTFKHVFAETGVAPRKFLQASALVPSAESGATSEGAAFRRETVDAIAAAARAVGAADVTVLDIGILLSTEGGLCPHTRLAARLGATRTGDGTQVLPAIALDRAGLCVAEVALAGTTAGTPPLTTRTKTVAEANISNTDFLNALRVACRDAGALTVPFGWVPVPSWALRLMAGPSACVILDSNVATTTTTTTTAGVCVDATAELRRAEALGPLLPFSSFFTGRR